MMPIQRFGMLLRVSTERPGRKLVGLDVPAPAPARPSHWSGPIGPHADYPMLVLQEIADGMAERGWRSDDPTDFKLIADLLDVLHVISARRRQDAAGDGWRRALPDARPAAVGGTR